MTKSLTTEVYNLNFFVKGTRIFFITRTPQGVEKRYWADLPSRTAKAITKEIDKHIETQAQNDNLTWAELQEKYKEWGGS